MAQERKGPGEKGKLLCHRVLLTNRSTVKHPHCPSMGSSTLRSRVLERRAGRVWDSPPPPDQGPKICFAQPPGSRMYAPGQTLTQPAPPRAQQKCLVPGPWAQALGPPFVIGDRSAWLWAGPEAPSRKLSDSAPTELPGRPGQAVKGQKKKAQKASPRSLSVLAAGINSGRKGNGSVTLRETTFANTPPSSWFAQTV